MPLTSRIPRSALRIVVMGCVVALVAVLGGLALERLRLGATDADVFARLEGQTVAEFRHTSTSLERMAQGVAARPAAIVAALSEQSAVRALFDAVDTVWRSAGSGPDLAITVYGPDAQPLAWSGRPSRIDRSTVVRDEPQLFADPGPLGLRLVYVVPVRDASQRRVGSVASERLLSTRRGIASVTAQDYMLAETLAPVSLRLPAEGAGEGTRAYSFPIQAPDGHVLLEASVKPADLQQTRQAWHDTLVSVVLAIVAFTVLLLVGPVLDLRTGARTAGWYLAATAAVLALVIVAWAVLTAAGRNASTLSPMFSASAPAAAPSDRPGDAPPTPDSAAPRSNRALGSPFDVLLASVALLAFVAAAFDVAQRWRVRGGRHRRGADASTAALASYVLAQVVVGVLFALLLTSYELFLRGTFIQTRIDILNFSVHPWNPARLSLAIGLLLLHASVLWAGVLAFRVALTPWRRGPGLTGALLPIVAWIAAFCLVAAVGISLAWRAPWAPAAIAYGAVVVAAALSGRVVPWYRHASQGLRLILSFLALLLPSVVMYPTLMHFADRANHIEIERSFAPEVMGQRDAIGDRVLNAMDQIDAIGGLGDLVASAGTNEMTFSTVAFNIWSRTDLATSRVASAVEVYSADGAMVSRFALYLPETSASLRAESPEQGCSWDLYEYVSRFGSQERKLLHAGRAICVPGPGGRAVAVGSIVVHAMLDYSALPFLSSQNPYYELMRPRDQRRREGVPAGEVDLTVYGWSGTQIYSSAAASPPLTDELFRRAYTSINAGGNRQPFWTSIESGGVNYDVYFQNDRGGIYALSFPTVAPIGHLVNIAELTTLAGLTYLLMLAGAMAFRAITGHRSGSGRALLREIRASFYRKVFLAFVAVAVVPVITLAFVAQAYIGGRLRADTEAAAVKTTAIAQRVIQDFNINALTPEIRPRPDIPRAMTPFDDDIMVWLSGVLDQDVNVFMGPELVATSERDLFMSQLLPMRTPADVYRAIALDHRSSFVGEERSGEFPYMLAAAPIRMADSDAILTVPLMLRQQEIEREIDEMNRRIVLASLLFILLGAGIGYTMAERIADPVSRLTRATRRIARGDLDARIVSTSSDELRRLVDAFNSMAADLQRQREQLERTNRLEAWHEMARQVAHDIKNPLTPIQLSAEHLQRVHSDRGRPLSPVLDECVSSILSQVRLLRQISAEFSSFASSPTANRVPTSLPDVIEEVMAPYRTGLAGRIAIEEDIPLSLPLVLVDRTLVGRAFANIVENALHAMTGTGRLTIRARLVSEQGKAYVEVFVADTGIGIEAEALAHLFEPYFSTKATGTGLGLAIAKRNITLNEGTIRVESRRGEGTMVVFTLPVVEKQQPVA